MNEIFRLVNQSNNSTYKIYVSFLEIYNETIRDLIYPTREVLDLREDPTRGTQVVGLSEIEVETA